MKKILLLSFMAIAIQTQAQNVGIGTTNPLGKLTVNTESVSWNFPSLLLTDDATDNNGGAILQFRNPSDKRMYLQSHFGSMANGSDTYMTFSHDATYNMRIRGDGNVGIGNLNPNLAGLVVDKKVGNVQAMFGSNTSGVSIESNFPGIHFNSYFNGSRKTISTGFTAGAEMNPNTGAFSVYTSPASTTGGNTASVFERLNISKDGIVGIPLVLELGYGQTKQVDNGKIALNNFGEANTLSLVGGGTAADGSDRRIKFFANGESDFTGPIKFSGALKPAGNAGAAGQVLTSNGALAPTWSTPAYGYDTKVLILMGETGDFANGVIRNIPITAILYNTNTTNIIVNSNYITINKSGLYHFDLTGNFTFQYLNNFPPDPEINFFLEAGYSSKIPLAKEYSPELVGNTTGSPQRTIWKTAVNANYDVYITAPANVGFQVQHPANTFERDTKASLGAYLIHE
jgi:hypothetical protein